jgi:hypothetical protein
MFTQACTNSTSNVIVTSSPTRNPPASSATFQFRPKSLRLIFAVAERPIRVLPHGSFPPGVGPLHVEQHFASDAVNRQVARYPEFALALAFHARRGESHLRVLLHFEEVGTLQVRVALGVARIDRRGWLGDLPDRDTSGTAGFYLPITRIVNEPGTTVPCGPRPPPGGGGGAGPRSWLIVKMWFVLLSNAMVRAPFIV